MLTGEKLGAAIEQAREKKGVSKKALADAMGVKPASVQDWVKYGRIAKERINDLVAYFADVVGPEHWGLDFHSVKPHQRGTSDGKEAAPSSSASAYNVTHLPEARIPVGDSPARRVYVVGRANGGLPERIWTDGGYLVGATEEYAVQATDDAFAFLTPIVGTSMSPVYNPGDFAFVEPSTPVEAGDDVLVRLTTGETMLKRLRSCHNGIQLESYNEPGTLFFAPEEVSWMYYVAHPVRRKKIKTRF